MMLETAFFSVYPTRNPHSPSPAKAVRQRQTQINMQYRVAWFMLQEVLLDDAVDVHRFGPHLPSHTLYVCCFHIHTLET